MKKKTNGRPRKDPLNPKTESVGFRTDLKTYNRIVKAAVKMELNFSEYCEMCVSAYTTKVLRTE